ncbi:MAG: hypothetical protein ACXADW_23950 [Candidatus Hodarchaeales archaeon]|jgi:hypothetical protein
MKPHSKKSNLTIQTAEDNNTYQLELDFIPLEPISTIKWPPNDLFPLNISRDINVLKEIIKDVKNSNQYLVVTGFTSLGHIIDFFGSENNFEHTELVRIVLGFEPLFKPRKSWDRAELANEIKEYWLERGYSVIKCGNLIKTIELIKEAKIQLMNNVGLKNFFQTKNIYKINVVSNTVHPCNNVTIVKER